jgi:hypothetical protein
MKANELRIGNWISVLDIQSIVIEIGESHAWLQGNAIPNRFEQLKPIPLTPEIMKMCKLNITDSLFDFDIKSFHFFAKKKDGGRVYFHYTGYNNSVHFNQICFHVYYLHDFQNLYFALTGEELQVNLNVAITN